MDESPGKLEGGLQATALACLLVLLAAFGVELAYGVAQEPLEVVRPVAEYQDLLLHRPGALRALFALDHLFIAAYLSFFAILAAYLWKIGRPRLVVGTAFGLLLATGVLDLLENVHILTLMAAAEQGRPPTPGRIDLQAVLSTTKFQLSYIGQALIGLVFPRETWLEKATVAALIFVQLPVGVLVHTAPHALAQWLELVRFGFFLVAFAGSVVIFGARRKKALMP
ncbi:MAG TPA: hypothetical protein VH208_11285 [Myxococcaceae bacterium]|nr:hypothetical protein [Myxococcaceae bacterium]